MDGVIPGNLLLFGEYAVLEENGLGLSAAVYPLVSWSAAEGSRLSGRQGSEVWEYDPLKPSMKSQKKNLLYCCWMKCSELAESMGRKLSAKKVSIDSSSLASEDGKLGFGSSAASAAAAVKAILELQDWRKELSREVIMQTAFLAHSSFQGKAGSGYDVFTSLSEGINLFTGGSSRKIKRTALPWLRFIGCFRGSNPVSTIESVYGYSEWKKANPEKCSEYTAKSNELILNLIDAENWNDAVPLINEIRELGQRLGSEIGVSAEFDIPEGLSANSNAVCKASGAGNELILVFSDKFPDNLPDIRKIELFEV